MLREAMRGEFLLAVDLGSTGVRALLVRGDGEVHARAYRRLPTFFPGPGLVEQNPEELWKRSLEVMREALALGGLGPGDLAGLGVVTQRATALAWDARSGEPLAPAVGWQDQRLAQRVKALRERGLPLSTQPSAAKWAWWLENEPAVRAAAAAGRLRLGTPDAWLTHRLTGGVAHVTDPGQASCTALYDLNGGSWSPALLELFEIEARALPRVVATNAVVGETPRALLGASVPVAVRAGDQQAAAFAQGVHAAGEAKLTLGTAAMLDLHTGRAPAAPAPGSFALALWRLAEGDAAFCLEGSVTTAGAAVDWIATVGLVPSSGAVDAVAAEVDSSEGVVFVPALQGLGTPFHDDTVRGLLGGLTRGSSAAHVVRAVLEGIAHRCADVCESLGFEKRPLRVDGGLARSDLLLQMLADFSGLELQRAAETETTALGCALLTGLGVGLLENPAACRRVLRPPTYFSPRKPVGDRQAARARWRAALERARC